MWANVTMYQMVRASRREGKFLGGESAWCQNYCNIGLIPDFKLIFKCFLTGTGSLPKYDYEDAGIEWSLEYRRVRADLIEVFKIIQGLSPVAFSTFFERSHNLHTRGHVLNKLHERRVHTELRHHFFTERVINIWNTLDEETVAVNSKHR